MAKDIEASLIQTAKKRPTTRAKIRLKVSHSTVTVDQFRKCGKNKIICNPKTTICVARLLVFGKTANFN